MNRKIENFFSSLDTLHEASVTDYTQNKIVLSGCVNTFCLTFELSWKAMKYVLESEGVDKGRTGSPKLILMAALTRGLIEDENAWLRMLRLLNDESHHYNQDCAIELCRMIPELLPYFDDLKDYVKMFQHRNPQLYVIGAYIHLDEETPHLHLNFVPWVSGCKRGLETKTSLKAALATRGFASEGKGNTEWKQWAEAEKDDIALIMRRYGIDWKNKNTHNQHLSVLDYKKQERVKEVADFEEKLEGAQVVLQLKEERIESLEKEIEDKHVSIRKEQSEAQKMLNDTKAETRKLQLETTDLRIKNSELRLEYYDNLDQLADKQKEIEAVQKEADKWMMIMDTAKWQTEQAQMKLEEAERLKKELLGTVDGDDYLKEQVIELRYQNQMLQEENRSLKDKLEKAYEFMKQFVIGGMNLLERFWEWIGEKVRDVGRGR